MQQPIEERRKLRRKYLVFFTRLFDQKSGLLLGHLADLTAEGMMIISEKPNDTQVTFDVRMDLPQSVFGKDHIDFQARSVWCKPDIDPTFWNTGFQLMDVQAEELEIIERIIEEYGIRE